LLKPFASGCVLVALCDPTAAAGGGGSGEGSGGGGGGGKGLDDGDVHDVEDGDGDDHDAVGDGVDGAPTAPLASETPAAAAQSAAPRATEHAHVQVTRPPESFTRQLAAALQGAASTKTYIALCRGNGEFLEDLGSGASTEFTASDGSSNPVELLLERTGAACGSEVRGGGGGGGGTASGACAGVSVDDTEKDGAGKAERGRGAANGQSSGAKPAPCGFGWFVVNKAIKNEKGVSKPSITEFKLIAGCNGATKNDASCVVMCRPRTGRWHQIRRHLNGLSHPILGDGAHGASKTNRYWRNKGLPDQQIGLHLYRMYLPATATTPMIDAIAPIGEGLAAMIRVECPALVGPLLLACPGIM
jgi:hypothetical protein